MAYTAFSVVFGEQPSAAKWNTLGENDAGFKDGSNIDAGAIKAAKIDWASTGANDGIWWEEIGRTTLGSAGTSITVSSLSARKYLRIVFSTIDAGATYTLRLRYNNDSGTNYATRRNTNGTVANSTNAAFNLISTGTNEPAFATVDVVNIATQEKLVNALCTFVVTAGEGTAPTEVIIHGKWDNTSDQITRIDLESASGNFAAGSEVVVLGHN